MYHDDYKAADRGYLLFHNFILFYFKYFFLEITSIITKLFELKC